MDEDAAVTVRGLQVRRGVTLALRNVDLSIPRAAITAVIGPSGAGKTTLLSVLNGGIEPDRGTVCAAGLGDLGSRDVLRQHRRCTATVYQNHALLGRLSALDNVLLGLADQRSALSAFLPWPRALQVRAMRCLDEVGLSEKALTRVDHLSGGERQRVAIARALVRDPMLIVADEPFASVDPVFADRFATALRRIVDEHAVTIVLALHQIELATKLADLVVGLAHGRVIFRGRAVDVTASDLERIFRSAQTSGPADSGHATAVNREGHRNAS